MNTASLYRLASTVEGTIGRFLTSTGFKCWTMECPDYDNEPFFSCINSGTYIVKLIHSPKYGPCYEITNVLDRTKILIHWGNWAGDKRKGYKCNSKGCILVGDKVSRHRQDMVLNSRITFHKFMHAMGGTPFKLRIINIYK